jgi:hypothetical protein
MAEPTLEMLMAMMQRTLDTQRETAGDIRDMKLRLTSIERQLGSNAASESEHYASVMGRMDRFDDRLGRVARRLEIGDA